MEIISYGLLAALMFSITALLSKKVLADIQHNDFLFIKALGLVLLSVITLGLGKQMIVLTLTPTAIAVYISIGVFRYFSDASFYKAIAVENPNASVVAIGALDNIIMTSVSVVIGFTTVSWQLGVGLILITVALGLLIEFKLTNIAHVPMKHALIVAITRTCKGISISFALKNGFTSIGILIIFEYIVMAILSAKRAQFKLYLTYPKVAYFRFLLMMLFSYIAIYAQSKALFIDTSIATILISCQLLIFALLNNIVNKHKFKTHEFLSGV